MLKRKEDVVGGYKQNNKQAAQGRTVRDSTVNREQDADAEKHRKNTDRHIATFNSSHTLTKSRME